VLIAVEAGVTQMSTLQKALSAPVHDEWGPRQVGTVFLIQLVLITKQPGQFALGFYNTYK